MRIDCLHIKVLIAEKGETQTQIARRCKISRQSLNAILQRGTCELRTAGKLAVGLGVPVSEILAKEGA